MGKEKRGSDETGAEKICNEGLRQKINFRKLLTGDCGTARHTDLVLLCKPRAGDCQLWRGQQGRCDHGVLSGAHGLPECEADRVPHLPSERRELLGMLFAGKVGTGDGDRHEQSVPAGKERGGEAACRGGLLYPARRENRCACQKSDRDKRGRPGNLTGDTGRYARADSLRGRDGQHEKYDADGKGVDAGGGSGRERAVFPCACQYGRQRGGAGDQGRQFFVRLSGGRHIAFAAR